jgi:hypothetical protein
MRFDAAELSEVDRKSLGPCTKEWNTVPLDKKIDMAGGLATSVVRAPHVGAAMCSFKH